MKVIEADIDDNNEKHIQKFLLFKKDYLKMKKLYQNSQVQNKVLEKQIHILECKLKLQQDKLSLSEIVQRQETIINYMQKRDDYTAMQNLYHALQEKVQDLESKLKSERMSYEQEIRNILDRTSKDDMANLQREESQLKSNEMNEKVLQLETTCQELSRKNDALNIILETVGLETDNEITSLNEKYSQELTFLKESKNKLEAENRLLIEKLIHQDKFYKGRLKLIEEQNNDLLQSVTNESKNKFLQTLDEAFSSNKNNTDSFNSPEPGQNIPEKVLFTPYVTDETIMDHF